MRTPPIAIAALAACATTAPAPALDHAGGPRDEGAGVLARASVKLLIDADREHTPGSPYGGGRYGGGLYGGAAYGGSMPTVGWGSSPPDRAPSYIVTDNLHGAIDGTVRWAGARPARVVSRCGAIDDPSVRIGADGGVGGVVVYITRIEIGRAITSSWKPPSVGGLVVKHGCALYPAAQVVAPTPAEIVVNGDGARVQLQITPPHGDRVDVELQEGGRTQVEATPGVTRVASADGTVGSAWVIAIDTPYYAITDDAGRFRIDELAPGSYDLAFWQAPLAHVKDGVFSYGPPTIVHHTARVDGGRPTTVGLTLPR